MEIIIAVILFFRQATKYLGSDYTSSAFFAGNVDLLFFVGIIGLFFVTKQKPFIRWFLVILLLGFIQAFAIQDLARTGLFVYLAKLTLCLSLLFFSRQRFPKLKLSWIVIPFSMLVAVWTTIAVAVGPNIAFWTINDTTNQFDSTRLMLTYIEPSELGFSIVIVLFALIYLFFKASFRGLRIMYALCIFINIYALYLAKPFGAIVIGLVALIAMVMYKLLYTNRTFRKSAAAVLLALFLVVSVIISSQPGGLLTSSSNTIVQRGVSAASGEDNSINYRVRLSFAVTVDSVARSPFIGQGFGTLGTEAFIDRYYDIGLRTTLANSFLAFITEAGAIGLIIVVYLIYRLYLAAFRSKSYLAFGLVTFIILYQFFGGFFSNPLTWAIYGVVLALEDMHKKGAIKVRPLSSKKVVLI